MSDLACKESNLNGQHPMGFVQSPDANSHPTPPTPQKEAVITHSVHPHVWSSMELSAISLLLGHHVWPSGFSFFLMGGRYGFGGVHARNGV